MKGLGDSVCGEGDAACWYFIHHLFTFVAPVPSMVPGPEWVLSSSLLN